MADDEDVCRVMSSENFDEVLNLVWGTNVKEEIFERWSQGIVSKDLLGIGNWSLK